jgi:uncharacterized membrane protein (DUF2068 family)
MSPSNEPLGKRPPTYVGIIGFKLLKGTLFLILAIIAYTLSDNNLPEDYRNLIGRLQPVLELLRVQPGNKFFTHIAQAIGTLTEGNVLVAAAGTLFYSLFSLVEGVGLIFRSTWAGWLAIGESAFFIPIELYELSRPTKFSWWLAGLLVINVIIVWYLLENRARLFHHHHHYHHPVEEPVAAADAERQGGGDPARPSGPRPEPVEGPAGQAAEPGRGGDAEKPGK